MTQPDHMGLVGKLKLYRVWFNYGWDQGGYVGATIKWAVGYTESEAIHALKERLCLEHEEWEHDLQRHFQVREITFIRAMTDEDIRQYEDYMKGLKHEH